MKTLKHWMVALDLTSMDVFLLGYINFLGGIFKTEKLTFIHILENPEITQDMIELFPNLDDPAEMIGAIQEELEEKIKNTLETDIDWSVRIVSGKATDTIINMMREYDPDLLVLGKKSAYEGEGIIAKKIVRYVPCSVLFVPETSRYQFKNLIVPINFNDQSAEALKFALELAEHCNAQLTAQHIYEYPPQFFPGIPVEEFRDQMKEPLQKKLDIFKKDHSLPDSIEYIFTLNKSRKTPDKVYEQSVKDQSDMIIVGARNRRTLANVLMDDLADRMINYAFGMPVLIYKNKKVYKGLIASFLQG